jgi:hypothetical protein
MFVRVVRVFHRLRSQGALPKTTLCLCFGHPTLTSWKVVLLRVVRIDFNMLDSHLRRRSIFQCARLGTQHRAPELWDAGFLSHYAVVVNNIRPRLLGNSHMHRCRAALDSRSALRGEAIQPSNSFACFPPARPETQ